ncbi:MAG: hypothetical protein HYZ57_04560 [Acidobacteria bacterium]|nr:hypothetical protein [Acidobacteriota bacterium]
MSRWLHGCALLGALPAWAASAEERAIAYLAREVPAWHAGNRCFSCHNNGDAARALYVALRLGRRVPGEALRETTSWLTKPSAWDQNRGDPRFSDKKLARLQFAAALADAFTSGATGNRAAMLEAAALIAADQRPDGSWEVEAETAAGSPVTWGAPLATAMSARTLEIAGAARFERALARARAWLRSTPLQSMTTAAAVLFGGIAERRRECLEFIGAAQASDGGWGPVAGAPAEAFDTALVLLALARLPPEDAGDLITRGRSWLARAQLPSGGWPETTRPPGGQSYAQHISTSGWAALALLETRGR